MKGVLDADLVFSWISVIIIVKHPPFSHFL